MTDETITGRQKLEAAVTRVGRAFDELVRTVEKCGAELEEQDLDKVFAFLSEVLNGSSNKAYLSRSTAVAANGGFSLDKYELNGAPRAQHRIAQNGHPVFQEMNEHGGRLVGQHRPERKSPLEDPDASDFLDDDD